MQSKSSERKKGGKTTKGFSMSSASLKARGGVKRESWDNQLSLDLDSAGAFKKIYIFI